MNARALFIVLFGLVSACSRSGDAAKPPVSTAAEPAAKPGGGKPGGGKTAATKSAGAKSRAASAAPGADAGKEPLRIIEDDDLKLEEADTNPFSENVTLKLSVTPQVRTQVTWGAKVMARLEPGKMDAEIVRPRGSGPLDLEFKAEGYMPYHARLYTDRNDRISVRLYRPEEAPNLFGYNRSPEGKDESAEKKEGVEKSAKAEKPERAAKPAKQEKSDEPAKAK
jgi:hypothetical protein